MLVTDIVKLVQLNGFLLDWLTQLYSGAFSRLNNKLYTIISGVSPNITDARVALF